MDSICPFEVLGLDKMSANEEDVNKQYRILILDYHPDKNPGLDTNEISMRLNDARDRAIASCQQIQQYERAYAEMEQMHTEAECGKKLKERDQLSQADKKIFDHVEQLREFIRAELTAKSTEQHAYLYSHVKEVALEVSRETHNYIPFDSHIGAYHRFVNNLYEQLASAEKQYKDMTNHAAEQRTSSLEELETKLQQAGTIVNEKLTSERDNAVSEVKMLRRDNKALTRERSCLRSEP